LILRNLIIFPSSKNQKCRSTLRPRVPGQTGRQIRYEEALALVLEKQVALLRAP
jgi:hypothetical protein